MKERTWLGILLSFAAPCRGKMAGSVVLAILSVAGGLRTVSRRLSDHPAVFGASGGLGGHCILVRRVSGRLCRQGGGICLSTMLAHVSAYTILEAFASRWQISS